MRRSSSISFFGFVLVVSSGCEIPIDVIPDQQSFNPQFPTTTTAIVGFPRENVDLNLRYGDSYVGELSVGDSVSLYLLTGDKPDMGVIDLRDTVRVAAWFPETWRLVGGLGGSHYGESGIATMQLRDSTGRAVLTALKPGLVYIRAINVITQVYSCTPVNCVPVIIVIGD
jgi:hypothetical protein